MTINRLHKGVLPNIPSNCQRLCVYSHHGVCDDPRTNKGNSDAHCHKSGNAKLLIELLPDSRIINGKN